MPCHAQPLCSGFPARSSALDANECNICWHSVTCMTASPFVTFFFFCSSHALRDGFRKQCCVTRDWFMGSPAGVCLWPITPVVQPISVLFCAGNGAATEHPDVSLPTMAFQLMLIRCLNSSHDGSPDFLFFHHAPG